METANLLPSSDINISGDYIQSQQQTKSDAKSVDPLLTTVLLPVCLQTLQQRAKLVTPQPWVTLRDDSWGTRQEENEGGGGV